MKINKTKTERVEQGEKRSKSRSNDDRGKKFKNALEKYADTRQRRDRQSAVFRQKKAQPRSTRVVGAESRTAGEDGSKFATVDSQGTPSQKNFPTFKKQRKPSELQCESALPKIETSEKPELSVQEKRALVSGEVNLTPDSPDTTLLRKSAPTAPTGPPRHEVTEAVLAKIINEGYVAEDLKGRKVVLMRVDVPGRGAVNMRLWRRTTGVELRLRADDSKLASDIRKHRGALQSGARERGIEFSCIEVVG